MFPRLTRRNRKGTTPTSPPGRGPLAASIEILYLRFPVHPNITVIQIGPGIQRIDKEGDSYFVVGTEDGPLAGKNGQNPRDNLPTLPGALGGRPAKESRSPKPLSCRTCAR